MLVVGGAVNGTHFSPLGLVPFFLDVILISSKTCSQLSCATLDPGTQQGYKF